MTFSDFEGLSETFNDTKHRAVCDPSTLHNDEVYKTLFIYMYYVGYLLSGDVPARYVRYTAMLRFAVSTHQQRPWMLACANVTADTE